MGKKIIKNPLVKKIIEVLSVNKLELVAKDLGLNKDNNIHFHKGLLTIEP